MLKVLLGLPLNELLYTMVGWRVALKKRELKKKWCYFVQLKRNEVFKNKDYMGICFAFLKKKRAIICVPFVCLKNMLGTH